MIKRQKNWNNNKILNYTIGNLWASPWTIIINGISIFNWFFTIIMSNESLAYISPWMTNTFIFCYITIIRINSNKNYDINGINIFKMNKRLILISTFTITTSTIKFARILDIKIADKDNISWIMLNNYIYTIISSTSFNIEFGICIFTIS